MVFSKQTMRFLATLCLLLAVVSSLFGAKKVVSPDTSAGNDQVDIVASIILTEEEVTQKLGADPGKGIVILQIRVIPKTDKPIQVSPNDFILLAHDDGERSKPFEPSEIAGQGALVVSNAPGAKSPKMGSSVGFGGMMGGGTGG